jgi:hypothetical protein
MTNNIACKLIAKHGKKAEIEIEGQRLEVSSDCLPASLKDNEEFSIYFLSQNEAKMKEGELAREILEEILNGK